LLHTGISAAKTSPAPLKRETGVLQAMRRKTNITIKNSTRFLDFDPAWEQRDHFPYVPLKLTNARKEEILKSQKYYLEQY